MEGPKAVAEGDAAADENQVNHRDADVVGKPGIDSWRLSIRAGVLTDLSN